MYRVIVIEDKRIICKEIIFSIPWKELNCILVGEATDGVEGISLIENKNPDIVILDIDLAVMNGFEVLESTYKNSSYSTIIISNSTNFYDAQKAFYYGVKGYLLKPVNKEELREIILLAQKECDLQKNWVAVQKYKEKIKGISLLQDFIQLNLEDDIVAGMLKYVEDHYREKIAIQNLVDYFNYSETYLNRRFKDIVKTTFIEYLNRYRIQKSIEYIGKGERSIQRLADLSGIRDYKYFNVVFRKYVGCSVKNYIRLM